MQLFISKGSDNEATVFNGFPTLKEVEMAKVIIIIGDERDKIEYDNAEFYRGQDKWVVHKAVSKKDILGVFSDGDVKSIYKQRIHDPKKG